MEMFIRLTKYDICQRREEGKPLLVVYYLMTILTPLTIASNVFMRNGTYSLVYVVTAYNTYACMCVYEYMYDCAFVCVGIYIHVYLHVYI